jgi:UDP-N-acetylmuramoyl-tripeptide--D-alanyl-D-alanine ligase
VTIPELYQLYKKYPFIQTDTRRLQTGDIFFALKGPNFNGNEFASQALKEGASFAVIDDPAYQSGDNYIIVDDVLCTLQLLAQYHRSQLNIPFLAITGSNGKTTTKELIRSVLATIFHTYATEGNLNNHIGIPLTILKIKPETEIAVLEMGANHQGEIRQYCEIANPTHGIITNIGKAHLEGFGGEEGVKKGKGELYEHIRKINGTVFLCTDLPHLTEMAHGISKIITYGTTKAMMNGEIISSDPFLKVQALNELINTQLTGAYNFYNVMAAVAVGKYFGVQPFHIKSAIEGYIPSNSRSQIIHLGTNTIIMDAYNANPSSMKAAIENFISIKAPQKVVMLGSMKELGKQSEEEHEQLVKYLQQYKWQEVVLVGEEFKKFNQRYRHFNDSLAAKDWFNQQHFENTFILIKGSRSIMMEKILK